MATVLVIDDDPDASATMGHMLAALGHAAIEACDGEAGLREIARHRPDLVICDIFMPEQDGLVTIKELSRRHPALPIVAISGHDSLWLSIAEEFGATVLATLAKPFGLTELQCCVDRLLHAHADPGP
jgi:DNA-binding NtrC family response regulator